MGMTRTRSGALLAELHAHTTWSDGILSVPALVDLYGAQGFDVLCITDHVSPHGARRPGAAIRHRREPRRLPRRDRARSARGRAKSTACWWFPASSSPTTIPIRRKRPTRWRSGYAASSPSTRASTRRSRWPSRPAPRSSRRTRSTTSRPRIRPAHATIRMRPGALRAGAPVRALQPDAALLLGGESRSAVRRERRLPPPRASRRLEERHPCARDEEPLIAHLRSRRPVFITEVGAETTRIAA